MKYKVGDKEFKVAVLDTPEKRMRGLKNIKDMPKGNGVLLVMEQAEDVPITMQDMLFPIDIVFVAGDQVAGVKRGRVGRKDDIRMGVPVTHVLEVNAGEANGVKKGAEAGLIGIKEEGGTIKYLAGDVPPEAGKLHLLDEDGKVQKNLEGDERVFSRKDTAKLIKLSKKARETEDEKDFEKLGAAFVKMINDQDSREPEYAEG